MDKGNERRKTMDSKAKKEALRAIEIQTERFLAELRQMPRTKKWARRRRGVQEQLAALGEEYRKLMA